MPDTFTYQFARPAAALAGFVGSFWLLRNAAPEAKEIVVLPDGRVDVIFSYAAAEPYHVLLMGIGTAPGPAPFAPGVVMAAVSLRLPGVEYLLGTPVADIVNAVRPLPPDFWGIEPADLADFEGFCAKLSARLLALVPTHPDRPRQRLFELLYAAQGARPVSELAAQAGCTPRQLNRYFQHWFGLPLKAYCAILRFRASFAHLKAGQLFPELPYADQAHFIREVRKLAGARPKDLAQNRDDRFIQFSALPDE